MRPCSHCGTQTKFHWDFDKDLWICKECYEILYYVRDKGVDKVENELSIYKKFWKQK